jgi:hypothetical protein
MPDYQKSKIYKLWSPSTGLTYFGSTTQSLSQRLGGHIRDNRRGGKYLCSSSEIIKCGDYKIELVEEYPCNNKQQLEKKEGEYIKNNECINKFVAGRTSKEWRQDNVEKILEYRKKYSEEHRLYNKEKARKYREANPDKIKEGSKKYREKNKERIKAKAKKYYEAKKCMALVVAQ